MDGDGFRVAAGAARPAARAAASSRSATATRSASACAATRPFPPCSSGCSAARGADVGVRNAGICGSDVAQQRRWLDSVLERAAPDVVVFAVSPWSLRTDHPVSPPARTAGAKLWNVVNARIAKVGNLVGGGGSRVAGASGSRTALVGWPPPSIVAWELDPLLEPRLAFDVRFAAAAAAIGGVTARLRAAEGAHPRAGAARRPDRSRA